jgi:hypothetical protein
MTGQAYDEKKAFDTAKLFSAVCKSSLPAYLNEQRARM